MKVTHSAIALTIAVTGAVALSACVPSPDSTPKPTPEPVQQSPAATPNPTARPSPVTASPAAGGDWIDQPQTAGGWVYTAQGGKTVASFRQPDGREILQLTCQSNLPLILLTRNDVVAGRVTIRTETMDQVVRVPPTSGRPTATIATIGVNWPILDAMALTKGRFAVETADSPTLYLPAWAEVTRVIEDCR